VLLASVVAGVHGWSIPFAGGDATPLGIAGSEHPLGAGQAVWHWLLASPALGIEALILAATACALPYVARRADLSIATFAAVLLGATLIAAPHAGAVPLVFAGWITYLVLTVQSRRLPERLEQRSFVTVVAQTRALLGDRLKAAGGSRWPRPQGRFRQAGAR
jgi:hypothetical protein